jgi:hypothetical protein
MTALILLNNGGVSLVDQDDLPELKQHRWFGYLGGSGRYYASTMIDGRRVYLHRLLMAPPSDMEVDHINGDSLDNRRANLRTVTHQDNQRNRRAGYGRTGIRNVYRTSDGFYEVKLNPKGGAIRAGRFRSLGDAERAAEQLRLAHFGRP